MTASLCIHWKVKVWPTILSFQIFFSRVGHLEYNIVLICLEIKPTFGLQIFLYFSRNLFCRIDAYLMWHSHNFVVWNWINVNLWIVWNDSHAAKPFFKGEVVSCRFTPLYIDTLMEGCTLSIDRNTVARS